MQTYFKSVKTQTWINNGLLSKAYIYLPVADQGIERTGPLEGIEPTQGQGCMLLRMHEESIIQTS